MKSLANFIITWWVIIAHKSGARVSSKDSRHETKRKKKIAIIGGGIGGSFTANYLALSDTASCILESISVFDPFPIMDGTSSKEDFSTRSTGIQGSRVQSLRLNDENKTVVELGASIIYGGNRLVKEMVENDPHHLTIAKPLTDKEDGGLSIWNGQGWQMKLTHQSPPLRVISILYRYNMDLIKISKAVDTALQEFELIYKYLDASKDTQLLNTPDEVWEHCGGLLRNASKISFDQLLEQLRIPNEITGIRRALPGQGLLRNELLTAANIVNYNQNNLEMNGLAGLVSSVPVIKGDLFSIKEGNAEIPKSAIMQGNKVAFQSKCSHNAPLINHLQKKISTVVTSDETIELWSDDNLFGIYDIVVLAVPLQHINIQFKKKDNELMDDLDLPIPVSSRRVYQQTITTVISNATLQDKFSTQGSAQPESIYFTKEGKEVEGISSISNLGNGMFKMFTSEVLSTELLASIFGHNHEVEYVKTWGGKDGGAYPRFSGGGDSSPPFLLYEESGAGPALYYTSAMESLVSAMEISAIGAKSVAKLISNRLDLKNDNIFDDSISGVSSRIEL